MEEYRIGIHDPQPIGVLEKLSTSSEDEYATAFDETPVKETPRKKNRVTIKKERTTSISPPGSPVIVPKKVKRVPLSILKKCDKEEAKQSFQRTSNKFDTILAPTDAPDVFRGDSYDPETTAGLMEIVETEMMKIHKNWLHRLPCQVSILEIFDNYLYWYLSNELFTETR